MSTSGWSFGFSPTLGVSGHGYEPRRTVRPVLLAVWNASDAALTARIWVMRALK